MKKQVAILILISVLFITTGCTGTGLYKRLIMDKSVTTSNSVRATWLGTAGMYITDGETGILIDPYVSRFGMSRIALGLKLLPNRDLVREWTDKIGRGKINTVIVSHSHFDHVADAPYFATETSALLVGTQSTLNVGRSYGMAEDKLMAVKPGETLQFGKFKLKFIESQHGPALFGRVPYPGTIDKPLILPAKASDYRLGGVYALLITHPSGTILHHGSAGFKPGMYDDIAADVLLLGIGGRGDTDGYLENVALKTKARLVVPIHFDNFFKPLDDGMSYLPMVKFDEFYEKAEKHSSEFSVRTLPFCKEVVILPLNE